MNMIYSDRKQLQKQKHLENVLESWKLKGDD
jgi:hypothetical protein